MCFAYLHSDVSCLPAAVLEEPEKHKGKTIPVVGEHISNPTIAQIISDVTGKTVKCGSTFMHSHPCLERSFRWHVNWSHPVLQSALGQKCLVPPLDTHT